MECWRFGEIEEIGEKRRTRTEREICRGEKREETDGGQGRGEQKRERGLGQRGGR